MAPRLSVLAGILAVAVGVMAASDPSYDHQTTTYSSHLKPSTQSGTFSIKPFFSPDHSVDTLTELVESVSSGGTIDIATPGFDSWSGCTPYTGCSGCTPTAMREESFPIFQALLNAVHQKNAQVRILTNNYNQATCVGSVAPLDFLSLNGVSIRYYTSTTFLHEKYISVDGVTAISSVNFSWTSFNKNREAGVVLGAGAEQFVAFAAQVFETDWNAGTEYVVGQTYSSSDMDIITDPSAITVVIPAPQDIPGAFVTPTPKFISESQTFEVFASPDYAYSTLMSDIKSATQSLIVHIYQVTDTSMCNEIQTLNSNGVNVTLLVSSSIYSTDDANSAAACYTQLQNAGMTVQATPTYYTYSHQKYWIVDGVKVGMSTGNWSPTDYPDQSSFPPYGNSGWADTNRDLTISSDGAGLINMFQTVFEQDYQRGSAWTGFSNVDMKTLKY